MFKKFTNHTLISVLCSAAILFVLGSAIWGYVALHAIQGPLVIHFTSESGVMETGTVGNIAGIGILGTIMVLVNTAIAFEFADRDRFLSMLLSATTLTLAILLFIAISAIIGVN